MHPYDKLSMAGRGVGVYAGDGSSNCAVNIASKESRETSGIEIEGVSLRGSFGIACTGCRREFFVS